MDSARLAFGNYHRRFGVEIEVNALDGRDFLESPLAPGELPEGIVYIGSLLSRFLAEPVSVQAWHYTHDNSQWVLKSDRSCGIELCSPVSHRFHGLNRICSVIDFLNQIPNIRIDARCSLHVHINVADCTPEQMSSILAYWVKSEPVFLDSMPSYRKKSRYFASIGSTDMLFHTFRNYDILPRLLGQHKYITINTYHRNKNHRQTIEFRILGHEGCLSSQTARNWILLTMHFLEMARHRPLPGLYSPGDPWSGLLWFDPKEVMELLGFMGDYELAPELLEVRRWFLKRLKENTGTGTGFWGPESRAFAARQVNEIISHLGLDI